MPSWLSVWEGRRAKLTSLGQAISLDDLVALDGFDAGAGQSEAQSFTSYAGEFVSWTGLTDGESVYEVGCGAGAFLMALTRCCKVQVSGCDFAANQIELARMVLPSGDFEVARADQLPVEPRADVVVSNGVFHYFESVEVALSVLDLMARKAARAVAVLDVPDAALRKESEALRREGLAPGEYERLYEELPHLYLSRGMFEEFAIDAGLELTIRQSFLPEYGNAPFRFSALMTLRP